MAPNLEGIVMVLWWYSRVDAQGTVEEAFSIDIQTTLAHADRRMHVPNIIGLKLCSNYTIIYSIKSARARESKEYKYAGE